MSCRLSVSDATVAFGGLRAVDNVTVTFAANRITGLIGPNGSGKSTLVNMISGQIPATAGRTLLGDDDITRLRPDLIVGKGLARTYQIPRVPPELSVEEVISVPFTYLRAGDRLIAGLRNERQVAEFCGLGPVFGRRCAQLSVTDLRRLEIARAIACGPRVLLLDEVMAGLSHEDSVRVVDTVRQIHAAGVTIVVIEHVMRIIADLCDDVVVLNNGSILATGSPQQVLGDPDVREAYLGKGFQL